MLGLRLLFETQRKISMRADEEQAEVQVHSPGKSSQGPGKVLVLQVRDNRTSPDQHAAQIQTPPTGQMLRLDSTQACFYFESEGRQECVRRSAAAVDEVFYIHEVIFNDGGHCWNSRTPLKKNWDQGSPPPTTPALPSFTAGL